MRAARRTPWGTLLCALLAGCAAPPAPAGRELWPDHAGAVRDLCFDAEGQLLASAGADGLIRLWRPETGELLRRIEVAQAPGMERLARRVLDRAVAEGQLRAEEFDESELSDWRRGLAALALSPRGERLAALILDAGGGWLEVYALPGGELLSRTQLQGRLDARLQLFEVRLEGVELRGEREGPPAGKRTYREPEDAFGAAARVQLGFQSETLLALGTPDPRGEWDWRGEPVSELELRSPRGAWDDTSGTAGLGRVHDLYQAPGSWRAAAISADKRWVALGDDFGRVVLHN